MYRWRVGQFRDRWRTPPLSRGSHPRKAWSATARPPCPGRGTGPPRHPRAIHQVNPARGLTSGADHFLMVLIADEEDVEVLGGKPLRLVVTLSPAGRWHRCPQVAALRLLAHLGDIRAPRRPRRRPRARSRPLPRRCARVSLMDHVGLVDDLLTHVAGHRRVPRRFDGLHGPVPPRAAGPGLGGRTRQVVAGISPMVVDRCATSGRTARYRYPPVQWSPLRKHPVPGRGRTRRSASGRRTPIPPAAGQTVSCSIWYDCACHGPVLRRQGRKARRAGMVGSAGTRSPDAGTYRGERSKCLCRRSMTASRKSRRRRCGRSSPPSASSCWSRTGSGRGPPGRSRAAARRQPPGQRIRPRSRSRLRHPATAGQISQASPAGCRDLAVAVTG